MTTKMGRRAKLNKETIGKAYRLMKEGQFDQVACALIGVSTETWYRWMREGEKILEDETYVPQKPNPNAYTPEMLQLMSDFYVAVKKGQAEAEQRMVSMITKASRDQWQAAAWYLERKYHSRWGRRSIIVDATGDKSQLEKYLEGMESDTDLTDDELQELGEGVPDVVEADEEPIEP